MVTVVTRDERVLKFPRANTFQVGVPQGQFAPPQTEPLRLFLVKRTEQIPQSTNSYPQWREERVAEMDWDDVLAVAVGEVNRG